MYVLAYFKHDRLWEYPPCSYLQIFHNLKYSANSNTLLLVAGCLAINMHNKSISYYIANIVNGRWLDFRTLRFFLSGTNGRPI